MQKLSLFIFLFTIYNNISYAYLGPGIGGGAIVATLGIIVAIFAVLFGLIWFPIKRILKKRKENKEKIENKID
tara:strand:- start:290 stop:508 length:219 start_codon:yes stop_codon:yes gene_type:complete